MDELKAQFLHIRAQEQAAQARARRWQTVANVAALICVFLALVTLLTACMPEPGSLRPVEAAPTALNDQVQVTPTAQDGPGTPEPAPTMPEHTPVLCGVSVGVSGGFLHLRSCAGPVCPSLAYLPEGEPVEILTAGPWPQVSTAQGVGYVNGHYLACE
jgi:hypothetical protein